MLFSTVAEYETEIANVSAAIVRQLKLGVSTNTQISGNGRQATETSLKDLKAYRSLLIYEKEMIDTSSSNTGGFIAGAGW